jgi:hypothetical protein
MKKTKNEILIVRGIEVFEIPNFPYFLNLFIN